MKISRPLLKVNQIISSSLILPFFQALSAMGLHTPTPIQAATVPLALLGRDVCACAVTGSGNSMKHSIAGNVYIHFQEKRSLFHYQFSNDYFINPIKQHRVHVY
jgi:hypothetical protein